MEIYTPSEESIAAYRDAIIQDGSGLDMDRYIYSQNGEGIGSFLGNIFRFVSPILGKAIKGTVNIAKPHLKRAATDVLTSGGKHILQKLSRENSDNSTPPPQKRPRYGRYPSKKSYRNQYE